MQLHSQGLDVVGAVGAAGEVREIELDPTRGASDTKPTTMSCKLQVPATSYMKWSFLRSSGLQSKLRAATLSYQIGSWEQ